MRCETFRDRGITAFVGLGILVTFAGPAEAQLMGRRRVTVQETVVAPQGVVAPPPVLVTPSRVKVRPRKVVVKERRGVIARVPAVVTSTAAASKPRVIESSPAVGERVIPPGTVREEDDMILDKLMESPAAVPQPR